ncbi:MAG: prenyltransferase/squalene oxidase repeat-containing protein [Planctomycetota bacterium]
MNPMMNTVARRRIALALGVSLCAASPDLGAQERRTSGSASDLITREVRQSVDRGLAYLAETQDPNGYWRQDVGFKLNSSYSVTNENSPHIGVTALCLIAFLAGGHVPGRGQYGEVIENGLDYVLSQVKPDGQILDAGSRMYSHAFATLFLSEVYGMTQREDVRRALQSAVNIIVSSQNREGGWRYKPFARESDMSITVCQVLALRSARNVGIAVPAETVVDAERYVRRSAVSRGDMDTFGHFGQFDQGGAFRYQLREHSRATFPLTAAGVTTLHAAGIYEDPVIDEAFDYLDGALNRFNRQNFGHYFFYYGHYYAVQAYYTSGSRFRGYYVDIRDLLIREQRPDGSWPCRVGPGHAFATAVSSLILQIPYQYLPIFQR